MRLIYYVLIVAVMAVAANRMSAEDQLTPIRYQNPGLVVDLGVGLWAWPLPMDYDGDGDLDLVVNCPDYPYAGTYFFENPGVADSQQPHTGMPIFKPAVRIAEKKSNVQVSEVNGRPIVSTPGTIYLDFPQHQYAKPVKLGLPSKLDLPFKRTRANQWKLIDWEHDGDLDLIVGIGVWDDYGWDDAWDEEGNWTNGPLHGYVYLIENLAGNDATQSEQDTELNSKQSVWKAVPQSEPWPDSLGARPQWAKPVQVVAGGSPVDVYGMPSPNLADFDGDGDFDLICGEFLDGFTWFENIGQRTQPKFAKGVRLTHEANARASGSSSRQAVRMDLQMITPVAIDWDRDGDVDLICGDEDGRVAFIERRPGSAMQESVSPNFEQPVYFQQIAEEIKFGALVTPVGVDWDGDGDEDIVCGNTAGYVGVIENLGGAPLPKFAAPRLLREVALQTGVTLNEPIRPQAGPKGSIQGPAEAKWGYTTISVADWDNDGTFDIIANNIWGKVSWYDRVQDLMSRAQPLEVARDTGPKPDWLWWSPGKELATQWRTTPCAVDWNDDGLVDLVMLDHEGYLAFYERLAIEDQNAEADDLRSPQPATLGPPQRIFKIQGPSEFDSRHRPVGDKTDGLLRLNANRAGASGRRKLHVVDWDGDGRKDLLVNSENANWLRNVKTDEDGFVWFEDMGKMDAKRLAGHTTSPTTVDWDQDGIPDLLLGAEDGRLYFKRNPRSK